MNERIHRTHKHPSPHTPRMLGRNVKRAPGSRTVEWIRRRRRWRASCKKSGVMLGQDVWGVVERDSPGRIISGHIWRMLPQVKHTLSTPLVDDVGRIGTVLYPTDDAGRGALATPHASAKTRSASATTLFGECCHHRRLVRGMGHYWRRCALLLDKDDFRISPHLGGRPGHMVLGLACLSFSPEKPAKRKLILL
jgi:hypothetical protein